MDTTDLLPARPCREPAAQAALIEEALLAIEQGDLTGAIERLAELDREGGVTATHEHLACLRELLALAPKIPRAYLKLLAEGARLGDSEFLRERLLALKQRNHSDAREVYGQLGLRAPLLRRRFGRLIDPLVNHTGGAHASLVPWRRLGGTVALLAMLLGIALSLPDATPHAPTVDLSTVEMEFDEEAALTSAVNILCADDPTDCEDARRLRSHLLQHECSAMERSVERLTRPLTSDAASDARSLLVRRASEACVARPHEKA